jgi:3-hydroxyisobutyrate dehydrogenase-like beta-hydroxyacid dehydrogenase
MVRRLVRAGHEVTAFARRSEVRDECSESGAAAVADASDAVVDADAVIVCLFADAQLRDLAFGAHAFVSAMRRGALLIVHTTGSPATSRELAERSETHQIRVVDAPVSGSSQDIDDGRVTVLIGGDPTNIEAASRFVAAYGDPILPIGPLGSAMAVKLLNNALFAAQIQLAGEVERVAATFSVDLGTVAHAILQSSGRSYAMEVAERFGSLAAVVDAAGPFLYKDVAVVDKIASELGIDLGVLGYVNTEGPLTFRSRAGDAR